MRPLRNNIGAHARTPLLYALFYMKRMPNKKATGNRERHHRNIAAIGHNALNSQKDAHKTLANEQKVTEVLRNIAS